MTLELKQISKNFGNKKILENIDIQIEEGQLLALLGCNGVGKTTLMRIITGFLQPDSGSIKLFGQDLNSLLSQGKTKSLIGYLPEGSPLHEEFTVIEFLEFIARIHFSQSLQAVHAITWVIQKLELEEVLDIKIENLSKGFRRRVGIAQAIIHNPKLVILDEPTDGLDPIQQIHVRKLIQEIAKDKIIIISTHILEEAEKLCNHVAILSSNRIVYNTEINNISKESLFNIFCDYSA